MQIIITDPRSRDLPLSEYFSFFWAKWVTGFQPSVHCASCLLGEYEERVHKGLRPGIRLNLGERAKGDVLYLCGVTKPYVHKLNFHLVVEPCETKGARTLMHCGYRVEILGGRWIAFNGDAAERLFPDKARSFLTCRNFQFGAQYYEGRYGANGSTKAHA